MLEQRVLSAEPRTGWADAGRYRTEPTSKRIGRSETLIWPPEKLRAFTGREAKCERSLVNVSWTQRSS